MAEEIRAMMTAKSRNLKEGKDYLIIPNAIASTANVVGLYAIAYYKAQAQIKKAVVDYCDLADRMELAQQEYQAIVDLEEAAEQSTKKLRLEKKIASLAEQRKLHVANAYPHLVKQIYAQRREAARPTRGQR